MKKKTKLILLSTSIISALVLSTSVAIPLALNNINRTNDAKQGFYKPATYQADQTLSPSASQNSQSLFYLGGYLANAYNQIFSSPIFENTGVPEQFISGSAANGQGINDITGGLMSVITYNPRPDLSSLPSVMQETFGPFNTKLFNQGLYQNIFGIGKANDLNIVSVVKDQTNNTFKLEINLNVISQTTLTNNDANTQYPIISTNSFKLDTSNTPDSYFNQMVNTPWKAKLVNGQRTPDAFWPINAVQQFLNYQLPKMMPQAKQENDITHDYVMQIVKNNVLGFLAFYYFSPDHNMFGKHLGNGEAFALASYLSPLNYKVTKSNSESLIVPNIQTTAKEYIGGSTVSPYFTDPQPFDYLTQQMIENKIIALGNPIDAGNDSISPTDAEQNTTDTEIGIEQKIAALINNQGGVSNQNIDPNDIHVVLIPNSANDQNGTVQVHIMVGDSTTPISINGTDTITITGFKKPTPPSQQQQNQNIADKINGLGNTINAGNPDETAPDAQNNPNTPQNVADKIAGIINNNGGVNGQQVNPNDIHVTPVPDSANGPDGSIKVNVTVGSGPDAVHVNNGNPITINGYKPVTTPTPTPNQQEQNQSIANAINNLPSPIKAGNPNESASDALNNTNTPQSIAQNIAQQLGSVNGQPVSPDNIHVTVVPNSANDPDGTIKVTVSVGSGSDAAPVNNGSPIVISGYKPVATPTPTPPSQQQQNQGIADKINGLGNTINAGNPDETAPDAQNNPNTPQNVADKIAGIINNNGGVNGQQVNPNDIHVTPVPDSANGPDGSIKVNVTVGSGPDAVHVNNGNPITINGYKPVTTPTPTPNQQEQNQSIANAINNLPSPIKAGNPNESASDALNNTNTPQSIAQNIAQQLGSVNGQPVSPDNIHVTVVPNSANDPDGTIKVTVSVGSGSDAAPVNNGSPIVISGYKPVATPTPTPPSQQQQNQSIANNINWLGNPIKVGNPNETAPDAQTNPNTPQNIANNIAGIINSNGGVNGQQVNPNDIHVTVVPNSANSADGSIKVNITVGSGADSSQVNNGNPVTINGYKPGSSTTTPNPDHNQPGTPTPNPDQNKPSQPGTPTPNPDQNKPSQKDQNQSIANAINNLPSPIKVGNPNESASDALNNTSTPQSIAQNIAQQLGHINGQPVSPNNIHVTIVPNSANDPNGTIKVNITVGSGSDAVPVNNGQPVVIGGYQPTSTSNPDQNKPQTPNPDHNQTPTPTPNPDQNKPSQPSPQQQNQAIADKINGLGNPINVGNNQETASNAINNSSTPQDIANQITNQINQNGGVNGQQISPNDIHVSIVPNSQNDQNGTIKVDITVGSGNTQVNVNNGNPITIGGYKPSTNNGGTIIVPGNQSNTTQANTGLTTGDKVAMGLVLGVLPAIVLALLATWFVLRKRKKDREQK